MHGETIHTELVEQAVRQAVTKFSRYAEATQMLRYWSIQLEGMPVQSPVCHSILTMVRAEYQKLLENNNCLNKAQNGDAKAIPQAQTNE